MCWSQTPRRILFHVVKATRRLRDSNWFLVGSVVLLNYALFASARERETLFSKDISDERREKSKKIYF